MTSFHGLPRLQKKAISPPHPPASACFLPPLSLTPRSFMRPLFSPALVWASTAHTSLILLPYGSPPCVCVFFFKSWRRRKRRGSPSAEAGAAQRSGCMLKRGRRGVAFGCVEVCVNSQPFSRRSLGACGHGYTVISATFIYACYLLSGRGSDVAAPRKCVHKKQWSLPKGLRSLRMVLLLTGGVRLFMGR